MSGLGLRALAVDSGEPEIFPLTAEAPGRTRLRLRALPGASAVQLELVDGAGVCRRFEIEAEGEEEVVVHLKRTADGRLDARCQGREVLSLPPDPRYAPAPPVDRRRLAPGLLDLAIVVDGTLRAPPAGVREPGARAAARDRAKAGAPWAPVDGEPEPANRPVSRLLACEEARDQYVELLVEVAATLAATAELRAGVFAFGDREPAGLRAPGLCPEYRLYPDEGDSWRLEPFAADALRRRLLAVPPTSGGDFVDALAAALDRCARLPWREGSRRVLVLSGDSPGYSVLHPPPAGASLLARRMDVDTRAQELHRLGVEIVTLYHRAPAGGHVLDYERVLLEHSAAQYIRLASRPDLAFEAASAEPAEVVRRLLDGPGLLAHGAGYGVLLEVAAGGES